MPEQLTKNKTKIGRKIMNGSRCALGLDPPATTSPTSPTSPTKSHPYHHMIFRRWANCSRSVVSSSFPAQKLIPGLLLSSLIANVLWRSISNDCYQMQSYAPAPQASCPNGTSCNDSYTRPPIIFGHIHIAKSGGTALNGILANKFERVCGHKGYSYDAYQDNERAKTMGGPVDVGYGRIRTQADAMGRIGYENCDYISQELSAGWWNNTFKGGRLHGTTLQLHVPCRDRLEHLMSQCNYNDQKIECDAASDEDLFASVKKCYINLDRFNWELKKDFDVKCFDFTAQFTEYVDYMSQYLEKRRFESTPLVKRESNKPRNKTSECIWSRPGIMKKIDGYLLDKIAYYKFCDQCIGSKDDIMKNHTIIFS